MKNRILIALLSIAVLTGVMHGIERTKNKPTYKAPENVSLLQAFASLYNAAKKDAGYVLRNNVGKSLENATEAQQVFLAQCHDGKCCYVRGKEMGIDFSKYPVMTTINSFDVYDMVNGEGAAKKALAEAALTYKDAEYQKAMADNPCSMFTPEQVKGMQASVQEELSDMIDQCTKKANFEKVKIDIKLTNCHADFVFVTESGYPYLNHSEVGIPCGQAVEDMKQRRRWTEEHIGRRFRSGIADMRICGNNMRICGKKKSDGTATENLNEKRPGEFVCYKFDPLDIADAQIILDQINGDIR
jgi:hypothetical protein